MQIPIYIINTLKELEKANFEAFVVGGCVRDILLKKTPNDWDITTIARPENILKIFPDSKYENDFGTVILPVRDKKDELLDVIEITTYRSESDYTDNRRPDSVVFEDKLESDLARRDFTVNAMAMKLSDSPLKIDDDLQKHVFELDGFLIVDLYGGRKDIKNKILRAVGEPSDRFKEDALRMMRGVRLSSQLGFELEPKTERAINKLSGNIKFVSKERIKDELIRIFSSDNPYQGIKNLHELKLLQYILPEIEQGIGMEQNHHHTYTVFKHSLMSLKNCPSKKWQVRFASFVHDIGKPKSKKIINGGVTFYNHEIIGARMLKKILTRLKFSNNDVEMIVNLVSNHMFYYNVDEVTASSVRKLLKKVGPENMKDLMDVRIADRLGSNVPKGKPYKLRHLEYMVEKVKNDPISVKMLKIDGNDLMKNLGIKPGPKIGTILDVLLSEVIEEPKLNTKEYLEKKSIELNNLDLDALRKQAKEKIEEKREEDDKNMKNDFWVK